MKLTSKEEDYLETIYRLSMDTNEVGISDVARERGVTPPTVISAVSRLKGSGLVSQRHYGKVFLSQAGREKAEEIYKIHKALKLFLNQVLQLPADISEKEACRMEHGMRKETLKRLTGFLEVILNCPQRKQYCLDQYNNLRMSDSNCQQD
jgi:DtxR family Mn-dependent transcriptional regulator